jgi:O-antigen/teichoic acid export membrane protein
LTLFGGILRLVLPITFVIWVGKSFPAMAMGFTAHAVFLMVAVVGLFAWIRRAPPATPELRRRWEQDLREYGRPFLLLGVGSWLLQFADRWIVERAFGAHEAGLFAFAANMGMMAPNMVMGAIMQFAFPIIFKKSDQARTASDWRQIARRCDEATVVLIVVSIVGLLTLDWISPYFLGWLISPQYKDALVMLAPAGAMFLTSQVNQFQYLLLQGQRNSAAMAKVMIAVTILKTGGSIVAAMISKEAFLAWLWISLPLGSLLGRGLIRSIALKEKHPV